MACLQLRLKDVKDDVIVAAVKALMPICHAHNVAFILNDRPDLVPVDFPWEPLAA